jgi:hypothetical protein
MEYPLKSGDKIDVVFESTNSILGVEVKSLRSGTDDIERGIYQCVKYSAVHKAENEVNNIKKRTNCILVLEGKLPRGLKRIINTLDITVLESITPSN